MKKHSKKILDELCNYLGQDVDHPMCKELLQHVNECPDCRIYLDTIKMTVSLYRKTYEPSPVPSDVKEKLFKTLKLKQSKIQE